MEKKLMVLAMLTILLALTALLSSRAWPVGSFAFFLSNLFASQNQTCLVSYGGNPGQVCEIASIGDWTVWGREIGTRIYIRSGVPFKNLILKHEECHVKQFLEGRYWEEKRKMPTSELEVAVKMEYECYMKIWN